MSECEYGEIYPALGREVRHRNFTIISQGFGTDGDSMRCIVLSKSGTLLGYCTIYRDGRVEVNVTSCWNQVREVARELF